MSERVFNDNIDAILGREPQRRQEQSEQRRLALQGLADALHLYQRTYDNTPTHPTVQQEAKCMQVVRLALEQAKPFLKEN